MSKQTVAALVHNANRLGHGAHTVAAAASFLHLPARALCVWCAAKVEGPAHRTASGGECSACPYVGRDCIVIEAAV